MRVAVVSDIHGNLTALEAVVEDLRHAAPDLIFHGGDLADGGSSPTEIVDRIRELGWQGVMGNTDEMLVRPEAFEAFASQSAAPPALWDAVREIAEATRTALGDERLAWMRELPRTLMTETLAVVHATPESCWKAPAESASDEDLSAVYRPLGRAMVAYGHTHRPSIRRVAGGPEFLVNTGSVGLPYDGDPRTSYLLIDEGKPSIRRVAYDMEKELNALAECGLPGAAWTAKMLRTSSPQMP
ncbi:MAG TPA: metallophosphoesterase family protein [Acidobacteriaceae bacterium]|jgi:putative phosphoesterase|nr:metallophosphoesterase family protein [Acidobacteriaceae bacterium]